MTEQQVLVGEAIRDARIYRGMTQRALAGQLDWAVEVLMLVELGEESLVEDALSLIALVLRIDAEWLSTGQVLPISDLVDEDFDPRDKGIRSLIESLADAPPQIAWTVFYALEGLIAQDRTLN